MKTQKTSVLTRAFQSNNWHYNPKHEQMLSNQKSTNNNSSHNWRQSLLELSVKTKREMYAPAGNLSHNVKPLWIRNDVHNPVCTSLEMQQHITSMCPATIVTVDFFLFLATFFTLSEIKTNIMSMTIAIVSTQERTNVSMCWRGTATVKQLE